MTTTITTKTTTAATAAVPADPTAAGIALVWLDPNALTAHPDNPRADLGDLAGLTASVAELGVLEPIIVSPTEVGGYQITAGHRRHAAAVAAGLALVPCLVRPDCTARVDQIVTMLAENMRRQGLTLVEEARGYAQLALAGLSATRIAKAVGSKRTQVTQALTVADSPVATTVAARYDLTLTQALAVAEFAEDDQAVKLLTVTAKTDPDRWDHVLGRLRADRAAKQAYQAKVAELTAAGITVVDEDDLPVGAARLAGLAGPDNQPLDPDTHTACPGHAVAPAPWDPDQTAVYCLDPAAHGHSERVTTLTPAGRPAPTGGGMTDEQKTERRQVIDNNKAWRAAEGVRREYVRALLARKTAPKGTLRFAVGFILAEPEYVGRGPDTLIADLLGADHAGPDWQRHAGADALAAAPDPRLPLVLAAQVAAAVEIQTGVHTWRHRDSRAARYLTWLAETGYTLSEIETLVANQGAEGGDR